MFKHFKNKLLFFALAASVLLSTSCVDTGVQSIPDSITYYSQLKITNLIPGASSASLTLNGQTLGSVNFGNETPGPQSAFLTIPSGNKTLIANFGGALTDTFKFAATTEYKIRVFLIGATRPYELVANSQRYIWQTKDSDQGKSLFPPDTGQVALFNGSPDVLLNSITFNGTSDTLTVEFDSPLALGDGSGYTKIKSGAYNVDVVYNDSMQVSFTNTFAAKGRYTAVIYDLVANLKNAIFIDD